MDWVFSALFSVFVAVIVLPLMLGVTAFLLVVLVLWSYYLTFEVPVLLWRWLFPEPPYRSPSERFEEVRARRKGAA